MCKKSSIFKKGIIFLTSLVLVLGIATLSPVTADAAKKAKVTKVQINDAKNKKLKSITLEKGKTYKLKPRVKVTTSPKKGTSTLSYKTNKPKIASVNKKGVITAKGKGTARITVTAKAGNKKTASITVKVTEVVKVTGVKVTPASAKVTVGATYQLKGEASPANAKNKSLTWTSSNPSVATVSSSGLVTGIKTGIATIKATAKDGSGKSGTCNVTIEPIVIASKKITEITISGAGLIVDNSVYALKFLYQTPQNDVLAKLAALEIKGKVEGTGEEVILGNPGVDAWSFESTYRPTTIGTYKAMAQLSDITGYSFATEDLKKLEVNVNVSAIQITKVTLSGTGLTVADGVYSISIPYGTTEANAKSALAALTRTATVEEGASPPTSTISTSWNIANYNADAEGTYQATATFSAPTGYAYAQGANTANVNVIVEAPTAITGITLSSSSLSYPAMTTEATITSALAAINLTAQVTGATAPALTTPTAAAWTITPTYTGVAGTYTATSTVASAPAGYRFNTGANNLSVTITIAPVTAEITALNASGTGYISGLGTGRNILAVDYGTTLDEAKAALAGLLIEGTVAPDRMPPALTAGTWTVANDYSPDAMGEEFLATATISIPSGYALKAGLSNTLTVYIRVSTPMGEELEKVEAGYGSFGVLDFEETNIDDLINAEVWTNCNRYYPVNIYEEGGAPKAGAIFKVFADADYLYTMATIYKQDALSTGSSNNYEQDSYEVFLNEDLEQTVYDDDNPNTKLVQYRVNYENEQSADHGPIERFTTRTKIIDGGYIVLTRMAFVDKWITTQERSMGFELQINLARGSRRLGTMTLFNAENQTYADPTQMGLIVLAPRTP